LFGGLIAAQALAAAGATVDPGKLPQSLHAYFVRGGQPDVDVELEVERTRDGRSFDTRRVTVVQAGAVILEMLSSFHVVEPGVDAHPPVTGTFPFEDGVTLGAAPTEELSQRFEIRTRTGIESGFTGPPYWIRTRTPIEHDPLVRACTLTYMSDMGLMAAARPPDTPLRFGSGYAASLDHAVWFHRPFQPDRWHCYYAGPLNSSGARGLALGGLADEHGTLIATMTQEALWRT
jgi:acyl-CoA thioesterase